MTSYSLQDAANVPSHARLTTVFEEPLMRTLTEDNIVQAQSEEPSAPFYLFGTDSPFEKRIRLGQQGIPICIYNNTYRKLSIKIASKSQGFFLRNENSGTTTDQKIPVGLILSGNNRYPGRCMHGTNNHMLISDVWPNFQNIDLNSTRLIGKMQTNHGTADVSLCHYDTDYIDSGQILSACEYPMYLIVVARAADIAKIAAGSYQLQLDFQVY